MSDREDSRRLDKRFYKLARRKYSIEDAAAYHEFAAAGYYDHKGDAYAYRKHIERILKEIGKNPGRGLELGAGSFLFGMELAKSGIPMDGVDNSEGMIHQFVLQQKEGYGQNLRLFQQDCVNMETGQYYDHAVSHGYGMWIFDPEADDWVFTSYTEGYDNNVSVFERTAEHLRPGSPFLINAFPFGGDYNQPKTLQLKNGRKYKSKLMRINGNSVRKHHSIVDDKGNVEWEAFFLRSKFTRRTTENALKRAGFELEGFDDDKNPKWYVTRKAI